MKAALLSVWLFVLTLSAYAGKAEMKLIEAAFRLDSVAVESLLKAGADPNAKYGKYDEKAFSDPWHLGLSAIGSENWTALLAVANASEWPPPPRKIKNTIEDLHWASDQAGKVPEKAREERRALKLKIGEFLIASGADVNVNDGHGATPLYDSVTNSSGLALLLIEKGANVNTQTGVYIDGPGDKTPLHLAVNEPQNLAALIQAGAALNQQDSTGATALHHAVWAENLASVKMLLDSGADPEVRNLDGKRPIDLIVERDGAPVVERAILRLLREFKNWHNKSGAGQPATKPADKAPGEAQPPTPTPKDGPR